ncbi:M17 family peptidase N-terminal domain-containing protein [Chromatium okenii]|uniref:Peptidase M17 leucyl aminopeptidase N-terminal domain-containing protein n=1 Tax=Chromatium okenii TaxID=61644 RepID=A0A2S7XN69_9GAMM|nr:M17 family peptidase N-terminal domain-containing protein [Chromatium okenii]PQJ95023.1 hypothetical protein CXB77_11815 [Chromatium okenii]
MSGAAADIDRASNGRLKALWEKGDLSGETGRTLLLYDVPGVTAERILLMDFGKSSALTRANYRKTLAAAINAIQQMHAGEAVLALPDLAGRHGCVSGAARGGDDR